MNKQFVDHLGRPLVEGVRVARAKRSGCSAAMEIRTVARINERGLFLDGSNTPISRTDNLLRI